MPVKRSGDVDGKRDFPATVRCMIVYWCTCTSGMFGSYCYAALSSYYSHEVLRLCLCVCVSVCLCACWLDYSKPLQVFIKKVFRNILAKLILTFCCIHIMASGFI